MKMRLIIFFGLLITLPAGGLAQVVQDTATRSLSPEQIGQLESCVEQTHAEMISGSRDRCSMPRTAYAAADNTDSMTHDLNWTIAPTGAFESYEYIPGTEERTHNTGQCVHEVHPRILSPKLFQCRLYTRGCGFTKEGGHVYGSCAVSIRYIPRNGDLVNIKEYCFAKVVGGSVSKPTTYKKGCILNF